MADTLNPARMIRRREALVIQQFRFARPVADIERSAAMYMSGLGLRRVGEFRNHAGFDGVMLQAESKDFHLEFTLSTTHPVRPSPTPEDLLVIYVPDTGSWTARCDALLDAGFEEVRPTNPYWEKNGRTFRDADGYLVVVQNATWTAP